MCSNNISVIYLTKILFHYLQMSEVHFVDVLDLAKQPGRVSRAGSPMGRFGLGRLANGTWN